MIRFIRRYLERLSQESERRFRNKRLAERYRLNSGRHRA